MTTLPDIDRARLPLGKRGAFEGVARRPWMASGMGTDEARTPATNQPRNQAQRVVEKVGRSITNSETPQFDARTVACGGRLHTCPRELGNGCQSSDVPCTEPT